MYAVYCYAYYFTIKGTKVGNSGLCYYQGWNFKEHLDALKASLLFLFVAPIGLNEECLQFILENTS